MEPFWRYVFALCFSFSSGHYITQKSEFNAERKPLHTRLSLKTSSTMLPHTINSMYVLLFDMIFISVGLDRLSYARIHLRKSDRFDAGHPVELPLDQSQN
ncbi:hypothetical protein P4S72_09305 [Vibrio sp. PP-XX7]